MVYVADMLRFDSAFQVEKDGENFKIYSLHFTEARWKSFNFVPEEVSNIKITAKEEREFQLKADGFREGIRFAQHVLNGRLIEGSI